MISNWDQRGLDQSQRYLELSESYRQAAMDFCYRMTRNKDQQTWPNASVVLLLACHSVELFLKGAILRRARDEDLPHHHRLEYFAERAKSLYPDDSAIFDLPFTSEEAEYSEDEILKNEPASIRYRYPTKKSGEEWTALEGFEPEVFFELLQFLGQAFSQLPD